MLQQTRCELVEKIYKHAVAALVVAVAGQKLPREPYSEPIKEAAWNLVEAFQAGQAVYKDNHWLVDKNFDDTITALVYALAGQKVRRGPYTEHVYKAVVKFVEAYRAGQEMENCRMTDFDEYKAEVERRRQIGLTIDPATAETMFWHADMNDPYDILDDEYHEGQYGREHFARHPGGVWVDFNDLPKRRMKLSGSATGTSWCSPTDWTTTTT
jgi:hypothetical protein